jgi:pyruvate kinase
MKKYVVPEIIESLQLEREQISTAISHAAFEVATKLKVDKILIVSQTGNMARILARHNFPMPLLAFLSEDIYKRQLSLTKSTYGYVFPRNMLIVTMH